MGGRIREGAFQLFLCRFPGIVLKRDTFEKIGYFDESVGGIADVHMWIRAFRTYGVLCVPMTTANYTVHSDALTMGMFNLPVIQSISDLFSWVESQKWIKRDILERCKVNYFHQFILAGTVRYLRRLDFQNARQTFNLFDSIDNKQQCEVKVKWRVIKVVMTVFWCLSDLLMQIPKRFKVGFVLRVL
ncbi:MAG: hypothetical protein HC799_18225 [Limnothrix sp. RL_2_0]|nr:hypothetical protein [Limnothrix sp. RL_2_0]